MTSKEDVHRIAEAGADLPAAEGVCIENDFIAIVPYKENRRDEIRTLEDLKPTFENFDKSQDGDTALAQHLWGYNMWTRAEQLRRLVYYFESVGVTDQAALKRWAATGSFEDDFQRQVKGLGPAVTSR